MYKPKSVQSYDRTVITCEEIAHAEIKMRNFTRGSLGRHIEISEFKFKSNQ